MNEPNECTEQARTDELVCSLRATKQVRVATFSADGRFLAFGGFVAISRRRDRSGDPS